MHVHKETLIHSIPPTSTIEMRKISRLTNLLNSVQPISKDCLRTSTTALFCSSIISNHKKSWQKAKNNPNLVIVIVHVHVPRVSCMYTRFKIMYHHVSEKYNIRYMYVCNVCMCGTHIIHTYVHVVTCIYI